MCLNFTLPLGVSMQNHYNYAIIALSSDLLHVILA